MTETTAEPTQQDQGATPQTQSTGTQTQQQHERKPEQPLGESGIKALQAERERADRLERELNGMKPMQEQWSAFQKVFGGAAEGEKPEDVVRNLQAEVTQMRRDSLVDNVARRHGITSDDDIAYLRLAPDAEAMQRLAERLKVTQTAAPVVQADPGQGARSTSQSARDAEYEQFFPNPSR